MSRRFHFDLKSGTINRSIGELPFYFRAMQTSAIRRSVAISKVIVRSANAAEKMINLSAGRLSDYREIN
jgi:hypothetical protein